MDTNHSADLAQLFASCKLGKRFSAPECAAIAQHLESRSYVKGQSVFVQGDSGDFMAFVTQGVVEVIKDISKTRDTIIIILGPGNNFGELSFMDGEPRSASVLAREDVSLLLLHKDRFQTMAKEHPNEAFKFLKQLAVYISKRLRLTTKELVYRA